MTKPRPLPADGPSSSQKALEVTRARGSQVCHFLRCQPGRLLCCYGGGPWPPGRLLSSHTFTPTEHVALRRRLSGQWRPWLRHRQGCLGVSGGCSSPWLYVLGWDADRKGAQWVPQDPHVLFTSVHSWFIKTPPGTQGLVQLLLAGGLAEWRHLPGPSVGNARTPCSCPRCLMFHHRGPRTRCPEAEACSRRCGTGLVSRAGLPLHRHMAASLEMP